MKLRKLAGLGIATVAAASFAMVSTSAVAAANHHAATKDVKCYGVNGCKGKGSCKSTDNGCKGKNSCKGKGVVSVSRSVCDQLGGTVKTASAAKAPKVSNAAAPATTAQAQPAQQVAGQQTAAATTTSTNQNQ